MKQNLLSSTLACLVVACSPLWSFPAETTTDKIDRDVWDVVSRTVVEYDIERMGEVYHPDAVLVSSRSTVPIGKALAGWGQGMEDQKARGARATVAFRFTSRRHDETTAFETGMFNYTEFDSAGNASPAYVPFEALLVKKDGRWLILMERQLEAGDESAWNALGE